MASPFIARGIARVLPIFVWAQVASGCVMDQLLGENPPEETDSTPSSSSSGSSASGGTSGGGTSGNTESSAGGTAQGGGTTGSGGAAGQSGAGPCESGLKETLAVIDWEYPSFGPPGCSGDGSLMLRASATLPDQEMLTVFVQKEDATPFMQAAVLSLYVGDGPTCPDPPNLDKASKAVVVGEIEQQIDLPISPDAWSLGETKLFWVGKDEGGFESWRATDTVAVRRICAP